MRIMTGALILAMASAAAAQTTAAEARRKLAAQKLSVDFQEISLENAVGFLRDATGLNFHIDAKVAESVPDAKVRLKVRDVSVSTVLKLMLQPHDLSATWREGTIVLMPKEEVRSNTVMRIYDIRAQMLKLQDFPGPKVELVSPAEASPLNQMGITIDLEPEPPIPEQTLLDLIQENTGGDSWQDGSNVSIDLADGRLVVTQSPAVHREIQLLLRKLEQYR